jgi:hypothetical protein
VNKDRKLEGGIDKENSKPWGLMDVAIIIVNVYL